MSNYVKQTTSAKVDPDIIDVLHRKAIRFGYSSFSAYINAVLENEARSSKIVDEDLEEIIDLIHEIILPHAKTTMLSDYSDENLTRKDLKNVIYELIKEKIDEDDLRLRRLVRAKLRAI